MERGLRAIHTVTLFDPASKCIPPSEAEGNTASRGAAPTRVTLVRVPMKEATRGGYRATSTDQIRGAGDK